MKCDGIIEEITLLLKKTKSVELIFFFLLLIVVAITFYSFYDITNKEHDKIEELLSKHQRNVEKIQLEVGRINAQIKVVENKIDSLKKYNQATVKRYRDEIKNIERIVKDNPDTMFVNSVLRYWTDRIYGLPDFFQ